MLDRQQRSQAHQDRFPASTSKNLGTRMKVSRKVMKAFLKCMQWTRTFAFVYGPVDHKWNRYKFYCQICKTNISIYSKSAREILGHLSTEKHLRKDQRWMYEYLYKTDPYTKARIP